MTTYPDLRQAHDTCGGVKLMYWDLNPPPNEMSKEKSKKTKAITDEPHKFLKNNHLEISNFLIKESLNQIYCCRN